MENNNLKDDYESVEIEARKILVRNLVINHINKHYHKEIVNLNNPIDIIAKI